MPGGNGQHDPVAQERLELERAVAAAGADDAQLEVAVEDAVDHRAGRVDPKRHLDVRVRGPEAAEKLWQHVLAGPGRRAHDQVTGRLVRVLGELAGELVAQGQHAQGVAMEHLAPVGRRRPAARAVDQRLAQHPLERLDLLAHGGLGHAQRVRGGRERPPLHNLDERLQLTQIHIR